MIDLIRSQISAIQQSDLLLGTLSKDETHHADTNQVCEGLFFSQVYENRDGGVFGAGCLFTSLKRDFDYFTSRANALLKSKRDNNQLVMRTGTITYDPGYFYMQFIGRDGIENVKVGLSDARVYTLKAWPLSLA